MVFEHTSYRSFLKAVLAERISHNPRYSLRAMARALDVSPSVLSHVFKKEKSISLDMAMRLAGKLELASDEASYFLLLVQHEDSKNEELREMAFSKIQAMRRQTETRDLSLDSFRVISDWYHIPILEMTALKGFDFSARNIAARLGISPVEAEAAIERLTRLELLEKKADGKYVKHLRDYVFRSPNANSALRKFHRQMIQRAAESLETQTPQEKSVGSQTFSIDPAQLREADRMIDEFFDKMVCFFNKGKNKTETYHLGIQLFRLTSKFGDLQ